MKPNMPRAPEFHSPILKALRPLWREPTIRATLLALIAVNHKRRTR